MFLGADFEAPRVETRRALIVVDLQNDFVTSEGKLPVRAADGILSRVAPLANEFRELGEVVWVQTEFSVPRESVSADTGSYVIILPRFVEGHDDGDDDGTPAEPQAAYDPAHPARETDPAAFLADFASPDHQRCCIPGTTGAEMPKELQDVFDNTRDMMVTKSDYSAFSTGSLLLNLRTRLVTELFVCGALSHISVYATVVDAIRYGFTITLIDDCLGHRCSPCHAEAILQMKDMMGAEGITSAELISTLRGEGDDGSESVVSRPFIPPRIPAAKGSSDSLSLRPKIEEWVDSIPHERTPGLSTNPSVTSSTDVRPNITSAVRATRHRTAPLDDASSNSTSSTSTPPRKRSTGDMDSKDIDEEIVNISDVRRLREAQKSDKQRVEARPARRRRRTLKGETGAEIPPARKDRSPSSDRGPSADVKGGTRGSIGREASVVSSLASEEPKQQSEEKSSDGQNTRQSFGEGDSFLIQDLLPESAVGTLFERLKREVQWQTMLHRSGEVPRLVAVQGWIQENDSVPVYRHPADESPRLLPFSPSVELIRNNIEKTIGHPFNHVLIQLYRNGEDNISEHSDKTLDIVRGTDIVNYSLGAQRTMTLRIKKTLAEEDGIADATNAGPSDKPNSRKSQRIPLPHNSLFILGPATNTSWLHSIRADKRRLAEKAQEELAFGGERISLTFRQIGTYVDLLSGLIWGQGATSKVAATAAKIHNDPQEMERLVIAFGEENHQAHDFDWDKTYGAGFDVVNFTTKSVELNTPTKPTTPLTASPKIEADDTSDSEADTPPLFIFNQTSDEIMNLRIKIVLVQAKISFVTVPPRPRSSKPEVIIQSTDSTQGFLRLSGYESITSHVSPTGRPPSTSRRGQQLWEGWQASKAKGSKKLVAPNAQLEEITALIEQRPGSLPTPNSELTSLERELWFILHDMKLQHTASEIVGPGVWKKDVKDFYDAIARNQVFSEALRMV